MCDRGVLDVIAEITFPTTTPHTLRNGTDGGSTERREGLVDLFALFQSASSRTSHVNALGSSQIDKVQFADLHCSCPFGRRITYRCREQTIDEAPPPVLHVVEVGDDSLRSVQSVEVTMDFSTMSFRIA